MKRKHKAAFTRTDERGMPMLVLVESSSPVTKVEDNSGKKWKRVARTYRRKSPTSSPNL